jgi:lipopolysaccharide transport system ATP-binding protein
MNEIIISARNLTKTYRLYAKPHYRFLDVLGLLRGIGKYSEHHALYGINLDVRRGEKIALIGRNGAGKSTLLKLITGVIQPSSGSLVVYSKANALLQIGATFHPEFTGRENVLSYLAHIGITSEAAKEKLFEIIEFSELEEYIDQPVKTYSTGMGARLMFSAATAMQPELLVIDEILSVGDAYFAHKSFERIKEMSDSQHTTLLLVSHDIYSASNLCDRMIWIERGSVYADGPSVGVMRAYEESIRLQEERRLDAKRQSMLAKVRSGNEADVLLGFLKRDTRNQGQIWISELRIIRGAKCLAQFNATQVADATGSGGVILDEHETSWGEPENVENKFARPLLSHGSIFNRYPFAFAHQGLSQFELDEPFSIEVDYLTTEEGNSFIGIYRPNDSSITRGGDLLFSPAGWATTRAEMTRPINAAHLEAYSLTSISRFGRRDIEITKVSFHDENGKICHQFRVGSTMSVRLAFKINKLGLHERPTLVVAFQKDGTLRTHRFTTDQIEFVSDDETEGIITVSAEPLLLGPGRYFVTVSVFRESYFVSSESKKFFSTNHGVYDIHARAYEIVVLPDLENPLNNDVVFLHECRWHKERDTNPKGPINQNSKSTIAYNTNQGAETFQE